MDELDCFVEYIDCLGLWRRSPTSFLVEFCPDSAFQPHCDHQQAQIRSNWDSLRTVASQKGKVLFNGGIMRLIGFSIAVGTTEPPPMPLSLDQLQMICAKITSSSSSSHGLLSLATASARFIDFMGTNVFLARHPEVAELYSVSPRFVQSLGAASCTYPQQDSSQDHCCGECVSPNLCNAIGVSSAPLTADGFYIFGQRSALVSQHPLRWHNIGGFWSFSDGFGPNLDPFAAMESEIVEELGISAADIADLGILSVLRAHDSKQPDLVFRTVLSLKRDEITALSSSENPAIDAFEHVRFCAVKNTRESLLKFLARMGGVRALTPVLAASMLLYVHLAPE